ncbi:MAG: MBL fold metallo-hydrolase, partial [Simkania negevensis]|nr:MBL fold metallo-hydrolase [Simkania negevensis]
MKAKILFLGTGSSTGVPMIGCDCSVCSSSSPFNKRLRPSALLKVENKTFLIDASPDLRLQALTYKINSLDGVLFTHTHYDHIAGLDELRIFHFKQKKPIPCLLSEESLRELKIRYHYFLPVYQRDEAHANKLDFFLLPGDQGKVIFQRLEISFFSYLQTGMKVNGYRFKDFAYVTDLYDYQEDLFEVLRGIETLVISGLRWNCSTAHLGIPDVLEIAKKVGAKKTYLMHISHEVDHEEMS